MTARTRSVLLWVLAVLITLAAAAYQRLTGPTYPVSGRARIGDTTLRFRLDRSHAGSTDHLVRVGVPDGEWRGWLRHRLHGSADGWTLVEMTLDGGALAGALPHQPPAGKIDYQVFLAPPPPEGGTPGDEAAVLGEAAPLTDPVTIRFRDPVPIAVLIPHVLLMFAAMLTSNRAGFEGLLRRGDPRRLAVWTFWLILVGGILVGMLVQKYSFHVWWTGFPLGDDITDSKTLVAQVAWLIALLASRRGGRAARFWVVVAAVVTFGIFLIPHSMS
ncbi:MAG: hypothetical protein FJY75_08705 [Candidatus Eisenbacteria bacterium]|uniref:Uncharacterized protein n=1 Tax=Eiseniibacteriota bacterium TaxID=2212470 RepID=A0A937XCG6_UNCEI|nr:hypothetical protein [Candidatus Eisenbacteria bacterium]